MRIFLIIGLITLYLLQIQARLTKNDENFMKATQKTIKTSKYVKKYLPMEVAAFVNLLSYEFMKKFAKAYDSINTNIKQNEGENFNVQSKILVNQAKQPSDNFTEIIHNSFLIQTKKVNVKAYKAKGWLSQLYNPHELNDGSFGLYASAHYTPNWDVEFKKDAKKTTRMGQEVMTSSGQFDTYIDKDLNAQVVFIPLKAEVSMILVRGSMKDPVFKKKFEKYEFKGRNEQMMSKLMEIRLPIFTETVIGKFEIPPKIFNDFVSDRRFCKDHKNEKSFIKFAKSFNMNPTGLRMRSDLTPKVKKVFDCVQHECQVVIATLPRLPRAEVAIVFTTTIHPQKYSK